MTFEYRLATDGPGYYMPRRPDVPTVYSGPTEENLIEVRNDSPGWKASTFSDRGDKLIIATTQDGSVLEEYNLSELFKPSSASLVQTVDIGNILAGSRDITFLSFNADGSKLITYEAVNGNLDVYDCGETYKLDFNSRESSTGILGVGESRNDGAFMQQGSKLALCGSDGLGNYQIEVLEFSTPFDPTTITSQNSFGFTVPSSTYDDTAPDDESFQGFSIFPGGKLATAGLRRRNPDTNNVFDRETVLYFGSAYDFSTLQILRADYQLPQGATDAVFYSEEKEGLIGAASTYTASGFDFSGDLERDFSQDNRVESLGFGGNESFGQGMDFNEGGTKVYAVGESDLMSVTELDAPYDMSSGTFIQEVNLSNTTQAANSNPNPYSVRWADGGNKFYLSGVPGAGGVDRVEEYSVGSPYELTGLSSDYLLDVSGEINSPDDVDVNNDGTTLYVKGGNQDVIVEYDMSTPFDLSTASVGDVFNIRGNGMDFLKNGEELVIVGDNFFDYYELGTPYDLSTASQLVSGAPLTSSANNVCVRVKDSIKYAYVVAERIENYQQFSFV